MIVYRSINEIPGPLPNAAVSIGNFDGVHLGHREIFRRVKRAAVELQGVSVIVTFEPHPLKVVPSTKEVTLINTAAEKEQLIAASGVDYLVIIPFTPEFANIGAADFVRSVIVEKIGARKVIIGYDYAFGRGRTGDVSFLRRMGAEFGFLVDVLDPIGDGSIAYSSSQIRKMIREGDVKGVVALLGRHFSVGGTVVHGHSRGSGLGFPTANIVTDKELIPAYGVYAVKIKIDDRLYDGACNIGDNPTFGDGTRSIETFVFDFAADLYGKEIRIYFIERIREERTFSDVEALKEAIARDVRSCREILGSTEVIAFREYLEEL